METSPFGCFRCSGIDHWADACPELIPPETKTAYWARIEKYKQWYWDKRITAPQKQKLISALNEMKPERKSA